MGWVPASFYTGIMAAYESTGNEKYRDYALQWASSNDWQPGPRLRHADDYCCGQTYLELYMLDQQENRLAPIKAKIDSIMVDPKLGREDWSWCDALYMAPPTLVRLAKATGEKKYINFMHNMYWDTAEFLFDREEGLFYRDENYFYQRSHNGSKVFWSRGNGWVMGGIVRILPYLDKKDKIRNRYIDLLKIMAKSVANQQGSDGLWRASLLDAEEYPAPETSGSGFFCYALAWGINNGYLPSEKYLPAVEKAWLGLVNAVHPDGKIGCVQRIGHRPDEVSFEDTHAYGAGAFLLAGSEMLKLTEKIN